MTKDSGIVKSGSEVVWEIINKKEKQLPEGETPIKICNQRLLTPSWWLSIHFTDCQEGFRNNG